MRFPKLRFSRRASLAILAATLTASAAGAATLHRFAITQTTGSEGAQAVLQTSAAGSAFQGEVGGSSANTGIKIPFGLLGEYDPSGSTFGIGTIGISTTGYGIAGESLSSSVYVPSILGYGGGAGPGVEGVSNGTSIAPGVYGVANTGGDAGDFVANKGDGLEAETRFGDFAVEGDSFVGSGTGNNTFGGTGYLGVYTGEGVMAEGYSGSASHPALSTTDFVGGSDLFGTFSCIEANNACTNQESFIVQSGSANRSGNASEYKGSSDVQISGDLYVVGNIYQGCLGFPATKSTECVDVPDSGNYSTSGVTRSAGGSDVTVYAPAQSVRTIEDVGSAQLVGGSAAVPIASDFRKTIDASRPYAVFLTPYGDNRGLYIASRTAAGFIVKEAQGGRSSLSFDYRIVAKPLGDTSQRFVAVTPRSRNTIAGYNVSHHVRGFKQRLPFNPAQKIVAPIALTR